MIANLVTVGVSSLVDNKFNLSIGMSLTIGRDIIPCAFFSRVLTLFESLPVSELTFRVKRSKIPFSVSLMFIISLAKVRNSKVRDSELFLSSVRLEPKSVDVFDNRELC